METLKKTPLHGRHIEAGAKMSPFGGFDMPIEYEGIVAEHEAVRSRAGVFDVSHMGEVLVSGPEAVRFVNYIFTNDVQTMPVGKILYGMMLHPDGGTIDDLLVYRTAEQEFLLVINAANIDKDVAWIMSHAQAFNVHAVNCSDRWAEIALQGPDAETIMMTVLGIDVSDLSFYTFKFLADGTIVSRTGYTGEDGFELYGTDARIDAMWQTLLAAGVAPCGLGCRDTLRFEAGLPLYGDELADDITPIEAGLGIFVKLDKPDFIGKDAIARQKAEGPTRKIIGLEIEGPAIARHGYEVLDADGNLVGTVTTGYRSISLGRNLAMALVEASVAAPGTELQVRVRRKVFPARVIKKRFYTPNYKK
ncbi:MAG: glycine cleavage system aminomethyltransferase GcvT [Muribaculaceae bacterium]|mgnify:CR=1 FL=1|nr:glycine cleavage system aminomethyltransferase GcvT [Muribaculaceae bacterium]